MQVQTLQCLNCQLVVYVGCPDGSVDTESIDSSSKVGFLTGCQESKTGNWHVFKFVEAVSLPSTETPAFVGPELPSKQKDFANPFKASYNWKIKYTDKAINDGYELHYKGYK